MNGSDTLCIPYIAVVQMDICPFAWDASAKTRTRGERECMLGSPTIVDWTGEGQGIEERKRGKNERADLQIRRTRAERKSPGRCDGRCTPAKLKGCISNAISYQICSRQRGEKTVELRPEARSWARRGGLVCLGSFPREFLCRVNGVHVVRPCKRARGPGRLSSVRPFG